MILKGFNILGLNEVITPADYTKLEAHLQIVLVKISLKACNTNIYTYICMFNLLLTIASEHKC